MDKTLAIVVHNVHGWDLDAGMLEAVLKHCASYNGTARTIDIYPQERRPDLSLHWLLRVIGEHGALTVGALQRVPGNPFEFHT